MVKVIFLCLKNDSTIQEDNERLGLSAAARHVIATMRFPPSLPPPSSSFSTRFPPLLLLLLFILLPHISSSLGRFYISIC